MIYQQNSSKPWVILALVCGIVVLVLGLYLGGMPQIGQAVSDQATRDAFSMDQTKNAYQPTQDSMQVTRTYESFAAQVTAIPMQQTATQNAEDGQLQSLVRAATQTAIAIDSYTHQQEAQATQTQLVSQAQIPQAQLTQQAVNFQNQQTGQITQETIITVAILLLASAVAYWFIASGRAKEKTAKAKLIVEERRKIELQRAINLKKDNQTPIYTPVEMHSQTSMPEPGNGNGHKN